MKKDFTGFDHKKKQMDLRGLGDVKVLKPTQIHHKENGSLKNEPSFAIVMEGVLITVVGEISLEMFNKGLNDIGYEIIKHGSMSA